MSEYGLEGKLFDSLASFFVRRTQSVRIGNSMSTKKRTYHGGPQGSNITLISFLVIINNVVDVVSGNSGLFVDDFSGWLSLKDNVLEVLKGDFSKLIKWSSTTQQLFHPKKFKLFQLKNDFPRKNLQNTDVFFGDQKLKWIFSKPFPKYIGAYLDDKLNFIYHMTKVVSIVDFNTWKLRNDTHNLYSATLKNKFYAWVFPHFLNSAPLWIFQCFKVIFCNSEPVYGYKTIYKKMNSLYIECGRLILGVSSKVDAFAVLCRLNWLPLNYVLATQSIFWLFRLKKIPNSKVSRLFFALKDDLFYDQQWGDSIFFKPAWDMLKRLEKNYNVKNKTDIDFYEESDIIKFKKLIKESAFYEFNDFWNKFDGRHTFNYFSESKYNLKRISSTTYSREAEKLYYSLSFKQNFLNKWNFTGNSSIKSDTDLCRFCKNNIEDVEHILCECSSLDYSVQQIACSYNKVELNTKNLLGNVKMKYDVEKFLVKNFLR